MTREEEYRECKEKKAEEAMYSICRTYEIDVPNHAVKDGYRHGFEDGVKWADQHPQYFRGQTDEMMERESLFVDDWFKEHKGVRPTYADAIAWAEKRMVEKACVWLNERLRNYAPFYDVVDRGRFIDGFVKEMEEQRMAEHKFTVEEIDEHLLVTYSDGSRSIYPSMEEFLKEECERFISDSLLDYGEVEVTIRNLDRGV